MERGWASGIGAGLQTQSWTILPKKIFESGEGQGILYVRRPGLSADVVMRFERIGTRLSEPLTPLFCPRLHPKTGRNLDRGARRPRRIDSSTCIGRLAD